MTGASTNGGRTSMLTTVPMTSSTRTVRGGCSSADVTRAPGRWPTEGIVCSCSSCRSLQRANRSARSGPQYLLLQQRARLLADLCRPLAITGQLDRLDIGDLAAGHGDLHLDVTVLIGSVASGEGTVAQTCRSCGRRGGWTG